MTWLDRAQVSLAHSIFTEFRIFLILIIRMRQSSPRIRKSLSALANIDERKGYFYCLKMLGILPVPPDSGFKEWVAVTPASFPPQTQLPSNKYYVPKCLHDVLINSHVSSCEHMNLYFSFYHRHLMILSEIFLNFAHQVLKGGLTKLRSVYTKAQLREVYEGREALWERVFE